MRRPRISFIPTQQLVSAICFDLVGIFELEFLLSPLNYNVYEGDSGPVKGKKKTNTENEMTNVIIVSATSRESVSWIRLS